MAHLDKLHLNTLLHRKSPYKTIANEQNTRQTDADSLLEGLWSLLPPLIERIARLPDPRRPGSGRHKLTVLLVYAIFLFQLASRRQATQEW